jgi:hypothetical protein
MLRSVDRLAVAGDREWSRAQAANEQLAQAVRSRRDETDAEFFMAGSLVTAVRRTLAELEPTTST